MAALDGAESGLSLSTAVRLHELWWKWLVLMEGSKGRHVEGEGGGETYSLAEDLVVRCILNRLLHLGITGIGSHDPILPLHLRR